MAPLLFALLFAASDPEVERGLALYKALEFDRAVVTLGRALVTNPLSREDQIEALATLGCAYTILDDAVHAEESFHRLLAIEPSYRLPESSSPRLLIAFDAARASFVPRIKTATTPPPPPGPAKPPAPVEADVREPDWFFWTAVVVVAALVGGVSIALAPSPAPEGTLGRLRLP